MTWSAVSVDLLRSSLAVEMRDTLWDSGGPRPEYGVRPTASGR